MWVTYVRARSTCAVVTHDPSRSLPAPQPLQEIVTRVFTSLQHQNLVSGMMELWNVNCGVGSTSHMGHARQWVIRKGGILVPHNAIYLNQFGHGKANEYPDLEHYRDMASNWDMYYSGSGSHFN